MDGSSAHVLYTAAQGSQADAGFDGPSILPGTPLATTALPRRYAIGVNALCAFCHIAPALHPTRALAASDDNMRDLVGEVANTISGNARREIGENLKISIPTVVTSSRERIEFPVKSRPVVIPIHWRNHSAQLVVCLQ